MRRTTTVVCVAGMAIVLVIAVARVDRPSDFRPAPAPVTTSRTLTAEERIRQRELLAPILQRHREQRLVGLPAVHLEELLPLADVTESWGAQSCHYFGDPSTASEGGSFGRISMLIRWTGDCPKVTHAWQPALVP